MKATIFILISLLLTTACSPAASDLLVLKEADAGTTIELQQGEIFQVTLEGNLTTGYNWVSAPIDPAILEMQGEPEFKAESDLIGSPGTISIQFKAVAPGQVVLHLDYKRPWEETIPPEKAFEITVVVK